MTLRFKTNLMALTFAVVTMTTAFAQSIVQPGDSLAQAGTTVQSNRGQSTTVHLTDGLLPSEPGYQTFSDTMPVVASVESGMTYAPAPVILACDCCEESCKRCRVRQPLKCRCKRRGCQGECAPEPSIKCPSCEGDVCKLSIKKDKEKKTCFKTKQEQICIPTVRLPWQKCCPPSVSKTRLVNRLKKHKYECETCKYKWSVVESDNCCTAAAPTAPTVANPADAQPVEESKPKVEFNETEVPAAPKVKGAFLRPWRTR